ncbi:hypothetical protein PIB30_001610 [Stylosanthes scabra]|uniref:Uncharacterized protein n=1 Tax=Stylosanthes scabra TaxID=79078 RepID=A0ABU6S2P2_9FABA|nr:hypothetical protein [Stylosanthes scabra]
MPSRTEESQEMRGQLTSRLPECYGNAERNGTNSLPQQGSRRTLGKEQLQMEMSLRIVKKKVLMRTHQTTPCARIQCAGTSDSDSEQVPEYVPGEGAGIEEDEEVLKYVPGAEPMGEEEDGVPNYVPGKSEKDPRRILRGTRGGSRGGS